mgnify:CR=1 FL=1
MTWYEVMELIEQIPMVSTTFNLKEYVGSFMIENFRQGQDFDESESEEEYEQNEFERLQKQCEKLGIKPPKERI